jgi:hypothetical protein
MRVAKVLVMAAFAAGICRGQTVPCKGDELSLDGECWAQVLNVDGRAVAPQIVWPKEVGRNPNGVPIWKCPSEYVPYLLGGTKTCIPKELGPAQRPAQITPPVPMVVEQAKASARPEPQSPCKVYFVAAEQDEEVTVNLQMVGLNEHQSDWYKKHGDQFAGICPADLDPTGKRVVLDEASESQLQSIVGDAPLYGIVWEEHRVFVPDTNGGHYAWSANGILSVWDRATNNGKGALTPIGPIHNTNKTIFSSSSTSLLKDALKEIQDREKQRLAVLGP